MTYDIGEMVPLNGLSCGRKKGEVVSRETTRNSDGAETVTGVYLRLSDGSVKLFKLAEWEPGSFLGHDTLGDLLLASGYVESKGPQLVKNVNIVPVEPMPKGWLGSLGAWRYKKGQADPEA